MERSNVLGKGGEDALEIDRDTELTVTRYDYQMRL
jgi:hypothetical protein